MNHSHEAKPEEEFLGVHTMMPGVLQNPKVWKGTILEENNGQLPPYVVCVGDRRRAKKTMQLFDKGSWTNLEEPVTKHGGNIGRICIGVGTFKGTPVAVFEHQMGGDALEIIASELLSKKVMAREFHLNGKTWRAPEKFAIRVGSCGGINTHVTSGAREIKPFDLVVASHQLGVQSADVQALTGSCNPCDPSIPDKMKRKLTQMGWRYRDNWPINDTDKEIASLLTQHANKKLEGSSKAIQCGNVSKDSLYSESNEESFIELREKYDVGSTEMEFGTLFRLSKTLSERGNPVRVGMVLCCVGVLPGGSFLEGPKWTELCSKNTQAGLMAALETLHELSKRHEASREL